ncbi:MAG: hypothetical protein QXS74_06420 [Nitrososphaeria archaeon]
MEIRCANCGSRNYIIIVKQTIELENDRVRDYYEEIEEIACTECLSSNFVTNDGKIVRPYNLLYLLKVNDVCSLIKR